MMNGAKKYKILVINPGSTSTKTAVYINEKSIAEKTLAHSTEELRRFACVGEQLYFRKEAVCRFLEEAGIHLSEMDCIVGRGGLLRPMTGGTYWVDERMCRELRESKREHASNLGALLAKELGDEIGIPAFIVDPVVVDEMGALAKISGCCNIERISIFHALNQKAAARKAAKKLGKPYRECNFIVAHLGGGISVGVHERGMVIDVNNALDGEGPFSPERSGGLPIGSLIELCFESGWTKKEVYRSLVGEGGLVSYLGTNDARGVELMIENGDKEAAAVFEAMAYQVAREIGGCAPIVNGQVDAVILTGGLAHSRRLLDWIIPRVEFLAPVLVFPGEGEMEALAAGALRVLQKKEEYKIYSPSFCK